MKPEPTARVKRLADPGQVPVNSLHLVLTIIANRTRTVVSNAQAVSHLIIGSKEHHFWSQLQISERLGQRVGTCANIPDASGNAQVKSKLLLLPHLLRQGKHLYSLFWEIRSNRT